MQHLDDVLSRTAGRWDGETRRTLRRHRRYPAGEIIVVDHVPRIIERPIADAFDVDPDRRAGGTAFRRHIDRHVEVEADLCEHPVALLQHDVVEKAVIFGRNRSRRQAARSVRARLGDLVRYRSEFAAMILRVGNLPLAGRRIPDQLEFLAGRQTLGGECHRGPGRGVFGRGFETADIAVLRLAHRHSGPSAAAAGAAGAFPGCISDAASNADATPASRRPPRVHVLLLIECLGLVRKQDAPLSRGIVQGRSLNSETCLISSLPARPRRPSIRSSAG